jgi:hypothetical protein
MLTNNDHWFLIQKYRRFSSIVQILTIIRSEMLALVQGRLLLLRAENATLLTETTQAAGRWQLVS